MPVLECNHLRRKIHCADDLHVCVDGDERVTFDPKAGNHKPCRVPLGVSYIEVFGHDDDGALLPAVFPLPESDMIEDHHAPHMAMTLEGGRTVEVVPLHRPAAWWSIASCHPADDAASARADSRKHLELAANDGQNMAMAPLEHDDAA